MNGAAVSLTGENRRPIDAAAIRLPDGRVVDGWTHCDCIINADAGYYDEGGISDEYFDMLNAGTIVEGFTASDDGRFLTRDEAADLCGVPRDDALAETLVAA